MTIAEDRPDEAAAAAEVEAAADDDAPVEIAAIAAVTPALVFRWAAAATLGVLAVLLASMAVYAVRDILVLVLIAVFVAVSLDPAVRWLVRKRVPRGWAVSAVMLLLVAALALFVWSIVPPLIHQGDVLVKHLPGYVRQLSDESRAVRELSARYHFTDKLSQLAADVPGRLATSALGFAQRFLGALLSTVTVLVLTIYFMADLPRLRRGLVRLFPRSRRTQVADIVNVVVDKVGAYMIGNIIISVFAGVSSFICLTVLRVPYALPLALWVAIADLIPMVGATLGASVCVLVALFTRGLWPAAILVTLFFVLYQQLENYLIAPRVLRNTVNMPAVAVLLAALIGGSVLGVVGALMAIPIAAAVRVVVSPAIAAMHGPPEPEAAEPEAPPA